MPDHNCQGWRKDQPDFRDLMYAAPQDVVAALPSKIDLSANITLPPWEPVWDQGRIGSCGPHTAGADLVYAALKQQGLTNPPMPSRLFIYYSTRQTMGTLDRDSGVSNRDMLKTLASRGWCDESLWPYDISKFTQRPPEACWQQAAQRKITQYLSVQQTEQQVLGCLANGDPFILGFTVYDNIDDEDTKRTGLIKMPTSRNRRIGGHDVLACGYSLEQRVIKFRNSWGKGWGEDGYGFLPLAYVLHPGMASDFWTVKHPSLPDQPQPPIPVPTPPIPVPTPPVPVPPSPPQPDGGIMGNLGAILKLLAQLGPLISWLMNNQATLQQVLEILKKIMEQFSVKYASTIVSVGLDRNQLRDLLLHSSGLFRGFATLTPSKVDDMLAGIFEQAIQTDWLLDLLVLLISGREQLTYGMIDQAAQGVLAAK